jgi:hypothetical protein
MSQSFRVETDTFGEIKVPSDKYWGAQTQRYVLLCIPLQVLAAMWSCRAVLSELVGLISS